MSLIRGFYIHRSIKWLIRLELKKCTIIIPSTFITWSALAILTLLCRSSHTSTSTLLLWLTTPWALVIVWLWKRQPSTFKAKLTEFVWITAESTMVKWRNFCKPSYNSRTSNLSYIDKTIFSRSRWNASRRYLPKVYQIICRSLESLTAI